jgi:hypothetical protein
MGTPDETFVGLARFKQRELSSDGRHMFRECDEKDELRQSLKSFLLRCKKATLAAKMALN